MSGNPFLDQQTLGQLYIHPARLASRTSALHRAKISGEDVAATICDLLTDLIDPRSVVVDIGCGRGTTTLALARRFELENVTAFDASPALLETVARRFAEGAMRVTTRQGDFHQLPFGTSTVDAVVAAFCLYHSSQPARVLAEIARCLRPGGVAVLVTKSANSYDELAEIVAASGLDPDAASRPSLYSSFHSANMPALASLRFTVEDVIDQRHVFCFRDFAHLGEYLATTPRYQLDGDAGSITTRLRDWRADYPVTMSSTVSYLLGARG